MYKIVKEKLAPRPDLLSGAQLIENLGELWRALPIFIFKLSTLTKLLKFPNKTPFRLHDQISCQKGLDVAYRK